MTSLQQTYIKLLQTNETYNVQCTQDCHIQTTPKMFSNVMTNASTDHVM